MIADILLLNSTSLSYLNLNNTIVAQPCFTYRKNESWVFDDTQMCQFHTDISTPALNTYFLNCDKEKNIVLGEWQGRPIDLVHEQFRSLLDKSAENLILVLSSAYSRTQMAYLSGVLKELATSVVIVPTPLAHIYAVPSGEYAVVEIEMHETVLTKIDVVDGIAVIKTSKSFPDFGLQSIYNSQYSSIKEEFIRQHRHDPDYITANKNTLIRQFREQCHEGGGKQIHLETGNYGVSIEAGNLRRPLPEQLLDEAGERKCWLVPLPLIPLQYMISGVPILPNLGGRHIPALINTVDPSAFAKSSDTNSVKFFHTVRHQQIT